jgi:hypothetical protein
MPGHQAAHKCFWSTHFRHQQNDSTAIFGHFGEGGGGPHTHPIDRVLQRYSESRYYYYLCRRADLT